MRRSWRWSPGRLDRLEGDGDDYRIRVRVNARTVGDVTHIHTVNPEFFLQLPLIKAKGIAVGSVHFLPETMDQSLHIPAPFPQGVLFLPHSIL